MLRFLDFWVFSKDEPELISPIELEKSLLHLTQKTRHPFSQELAKEIVQLTQGHPYQTEKLASYVFQSTQEISKFKTLHEFLDAVINQVIEQEESIYKNYFNLLTFNQKNVLIAIADYAEKIPSNKMVRTYQFIELIIAGALLGLIVKS
ncbi:MAG: hypothetical protein HY072_09800 [Deltaproteobacteria bacterium]|nr:hypothetical protein [Deltaproteobacteria bacterium]